jgi:glycyl-tRNA synthetase
MTQPLDFQSIIMALQKFWADQGCLIWQPYYSQVGAGTMNPATFLRTLGPEPWSVAYVEPSVRPDDGRYGENPNRLQMHYQFQVILKPDTGNPQEQYLDSLKALGIDPAQHDIRFVEDNWEQPAISAWGLGWEVWLDGQEITQFTYFQQVGGQPLDPVAVEITYGLDRILIALQNAASVWEVPWNGKIKYGEVRHQEEFEHSKYYFELADVERARQMYELYAAEANACLEAKLVLPAHDYVLKCSHAFNVLDARGAIGVTERQAYFGRMRELARRVAEAYLEQRQHLEYPWLKEAGVVSGGMAEGAVKAAPLPAPSAPQPFLLEIGVEELPAADLDAVLAQLETRAAAWLDELRLAHGAITVAGTPRRLTLLVEALAPNQPDLEQVVKGPPADRAFDANGQPTKAAEGFARGKGVVVSDLQVREIDGGRYVAAVVRQTGRPAPQVLVEALPGLVAGLRFDKSMRWNASNVAFSRPVRWLVALLGEQVIPFEYAGLRAGNVTRGLRYAEPKEFTLQNPAHYFESLKQQGILLDQAARKAEIERQVRRLGAQAGGEALIEPGLLAEVTNLVEAPTALLGSFDAEHLRLPREVLISVMKKHQRYFPVQLAGQLQPYFIAVANQPGGQSEAYPLVVAGNEHVIRARFADADFFVRDDLKRPLEAFVPRLGTLAFQVKLGSMLDKVKRVRTLVETLATALGLDAQTLPVALRAAELCKADLATRMVVEMTSLQGNMGRFYALKAGEPPAVAEAIYEHYLPRFAGDALPASRPGLAVGVADRLDTLAGLFAAGLAPTGAKDPFAQRRAALGLVQALTGHKMDFDLRQGLAAAAARLPIAASDEAQAACLSFIVERLRNLLLEQGQRYDVVDAVLAAQGHNPARAVQAVSELTAWVQRPDWNTLLPAYARCVRITRDQAEQYPVRPEAFVEAPEGELYAALQTAEAAARRPGAVDDLFNAFTPVIPAITRFFDVVLVMAEDPALRSNRLGLLQRLAALAAGVADLSKLEGF